MSSRTNLTSVIGLVGLLGLALVACGGDDTSSGVDPVGRPSNGKGSDPSTPGSESDEEEEGASNGTAPTGDCVVKFNITKTTTWSPSSCPDGYLVKYQLEVRGSAELHIEPGTIVKLASSGSLTITDSAALIAKGEPNAKVVFDGATVGSPSWSGLKLTSSNPLNELTHVSIRHAGSNPSTFFSALTVSKEGVLALADVEILDNANVGFGLWNTARLTRFDRVTLARNTGGAAHVTVPMVKYLKGESTVIEGNGVGNAVVVETSSLHKITEDTVWPSLPAPYRITGVDGSGGDILEVEKHLEIEPGTVIELSPGSGILVEGGTSGLKAVGTADRKIVFRGVDGSSWSGITFGESAWSGNRLENVEVRNAAGAPSWGYYGTGNSATPKAGILLGYNFSTPVALVLKDFLVSGPNNAPADIAVKGASSLGKEGSVVGTGAAGALTVQSL